MSLLRMWRVDMEKTVFMDWRIIGNTFLLATAGGLLFQAVSIPLPWMLGPLILVFIGSQVMAKPVCWPPQLRNASLVLLGYMIGKSFTAAAAQQMLIQLPVMFLVTVLILGMSFTVGLSDPYPNRNQPVDRPAGQCSRRIHTNWC